MSTTTGPVLVTGANGHLGRRLLRRLAGASPPRPARAVVRSQRAARTVSGLPSVHADVRIVDYGDADALARAAEGCTRAVHLVGILKATRANRYEDAHERPARALAEAAERVGVERIVCLSILGSHPDAANACLASKGRAEQILLEGDVPVLVLRVPMVLGPDDQASAALRRQVAGGRVRLVRGGATREQPIAADDVVEAIVAGLDAPGLDDVALDLAGPESLTHRALVERAAAVLGTSVRIGSVPLWPVRLFAALAARFSADPPLTPAMLGVLEHDDDVDPKPACARLGIELTPLDETLRRALVPEEGDPA